MTSVAGAAHAPADALSAGDWLLCASAASSVLWVREASSRLAARVR